MRSIDYNSIRTCAHEHLYTLDSIRLHSHCSSNEKTALAVLRRDRIVLDLHEVLVCDEADKSAVAIDYREFLDLVLTKYICSVRKADALLCCYKILLCHDLRHRHLRVPLETKVTVGHNAHKETVVIYNRNSTDMVLSHHTENLTYGSIRMDGDRVIDHSVFRPLHTTHLIHLFLDGHVLVNDTDTTGTSHRDGKFGLCHGIHGSRNDRSLEGDVPRELGRNIHTSWKYL